MTDNNKFLFPATDNYMSDYNANIPSPYATKVELSNAPVLYQEGAFSYMNTNGSPVSVGEPTTTPIPVTTTIDASTASMMDQSNHGGCYHPHPPHQQQLLPESSLTSQQQQESNGGYGVQLNSPSTSLSTLTSCSTSPASAPLMNTPMGNSTGMIGLGLLPCTPTSPSSSSPSPSSSASVSSSLIQCPMNSEPMRHQQLPQTADSFYPGLLQYSKDNSYEHQSNLQEQHQPLSGPKKRRSQQQITTVPSMPCGNSDAVTPSTSEGGRAIDDFAENDRHHHHHHQQQQQHNVITTTTPKTDKWADHIKTEISSPPSHQQQKRHSQSSIVSNSELRRQIHIQSEQKRRAQIKDGFEDLRNELPSCLNKKMSKVALLHRTVQHIQHLKSSQVTILAELERLANENEQLRKFQESVLQKQALEKMYHMNNTHPL
ncbi:hypothetical protein INT45_012166 [Circinella minor]|uniref:BHLH domain-containing protein n=1 Tax=Circinella minor TaxID=1195481 RepID=A0A8H7SAB3_9FUNG|nr:hypothetical protein INT45_012166 [Circinella minor]